MIAKAVVVAILLGIVFSLGAALVFLIRDRGASSRTARALTLRVCASISLFALLLALWGMGVITPHGVTP